MEYVFVAKVFKIHKENTKNTKKKKKNERQTPRIRTRRIRSRQKISLFTFIRHDICVVLGSGLQTFCFVFRSCVEFVRRVEPFKNDSDEFRSTI